MACTPISLLSSTVTLLEALLDAFGKEAGALDQQVIGRLFVYAMIWTVAGILEADDRAKVDAKLRSKECAKLLGVELPDTQAPDTVYEYRVDEASGEWVHWVRQIPAIELPQGKDLGNKFATILVPTIDSVRNEYTLGLSVSLGRPVLLVGGPGTAKTATVLQFLDKQDKTTTLTKKISFSSATTPIIFQRQVEASVEKRQGKTFGPPGGKKMLVFLDDLSLPEVNKWGHQPTLELVRQTISQGGFFHLGKESGVKLLRKLGLLGVILTNVFQGNYDVIKEYAKQRQSN